MDTVIREVKRFHFIDRSKKDYTNHYLVTFIDGTKKYYYYPTDIITRFIKCANCVYGTTWKGKNITVWRF